MSEATLDLLTALQFGDGQFPNGGFAFSWGLESLIADGLLARCDFSRFLDGQLRQRWMSFDRGLVAHAHAASGDLDRLLELDDLTDASVTVDATRSGSRRAGAALLGTHARLATPGAAAFKAEIDSGRGFAHLPVVQGIVFAGAGLDLAAATTISAYSMAQGLCTAAIRLGLIGHLDAQRALSALRPLIAGVVSSTIPRLDELCSFVPVIDIAAMRHAEQKQRLFSN